MDALEIIMAFIEMTYQQRSVETEKEMKHRKREVGQALKRIAELDHIFKQIYEDDINHSPCAGKGGRKTAGYIGT